MGDLDFQIFGIKIDHFRGLNGPLEGQGGACESKIVPKRGLKQAFLVHFGFTRKKWVDNFFPDPREVQPDLGDAGF